MSALPQIVHAATDADAIRFRILEDRDPLAPATLAGPAAEVRECLMFGLAGPATREARPS